jgi:transcriptional regulator with XRE-family HTH domain
MLHLVQPTSSEEINKSIGANVAALRTEAGWSQAELAERWGNALGHRVDPTTVTRLERGRRPTTVHELVQLARLFDVRHWYDLVQEPTVRAAAADLDRANTRVFGSYNRIRDATYEYLDALTDLTLSIRLAQDRGAYVDPASFQHWLTRGPLYPMLEGQLKWKRHWQQDELYNADQARVREVTAVLRDKGLIEDFDPELMFTSTPGGDDVEH